MDSTQHTDKEEATVVFEDLYGFQIEATQQQRQEIVEAESSAAAAWKEQLPTIGSVEWNGPVGAGAERELVDAILSIPVSRLTPLVTMFGFPPCLRPALWSRLSGADLFADCAGKDTMGLCLRLADASTDQTPCSSGRNALPSDFALSRRLSRQIEIDLPRTFSENVHFQSDTASSEYEGASPGQYAASPRGPSHSLIPALRRVLRAYCAFNHSVSYVQSMNFLAGFFLLVTQGDETRSFWLLHAWITHLLPGVYEPGMRGVQAATSVFRANVDRRLPYVSAVLESAALDAGFLLPRWMLCGFLNALPSPVTAHLWDVLFLSSASSPVEQGGARTLVTKGPVPGVSDAGRWSLWTVHAQPVGSAIRLLTQVGVGVLRVHRADIVQAGRDGIPSLALTLQALGGTITHGHTLLAHALHEGCHVDRGTWSQAWEAAICDVMDGDDADSNGAGPERVAAEDHGTGTKELDGNRAAGGLLERQKRHESMLGPMHPADQFAVLEHGRAVTKEPLATPRTPLLSPMCGMTPRSATIEKPSRANPLVRRLWNGATPSDRVSGTSPSAAASPLLRRAVFQASSSHRPLPPPSPCRDSESHASSSLLSSPSGAAPEATTTTTPQGLFGVSSPAFSLGSVVSSANRRSRHSMTPPVRHTALPLFDSPVVTRDGASNPKSSTLPACLTQSPPAFAATPRGRDCPRTPAIPSTAHAACSVRSVRSHRHPLAAPSAQHPFLHPVVRRRWGMCDQEGACRVQALTGLFEWGLRSPRTIPGEALWWVLSAPSAGGMPQEASSHVLPCNDVSESLVDFFAQHPPPSCSPVPWQADSATGPPMAADRPIALGEATNTHSQRQSVSGKSTPLSRLRSWWGKITTPTMARKRRRANAADDELEHGSEGATLLVHQRTAKDWEPSSENVPLEVLHPKE